MRARSDVAAEIENKHYLCVVTLHSQVELKRDIVEAVTHRMTGETGYRCGLLWWAEVVINKIACQAHSTHRQRRRQGKRQASRASPATRDAQFGGGPRLEGAHCSAAFRVADGLRARRGCGFATGAGSSLWLPVSSLDSPGHFGITRPVAITGLIEQSCDKASGINVGATANHHHLQPRTAPRYSVQVPADS